MSGFQGAIAIVTGGGSGIGESISRRLAAQGATVEIADLSEEGGARVAESIRSDGGRARSRRVDVTSASEVDALVADVFAKHGRLDLIFNNAGIAIFGETRDMSADDWTHIVDVNIRGVIHGTHSAYPRMIEQGSGHIVNTASLAGLVPSAGGSAYSMTKHAVVGLSGALRSEAAAFGVKVSALCPGFIDTPILHHMKLLSSDLDTTIANFPFKLHSPDECARRALIGVERNKAIIPVTGLAWTTWLLYRLSPALLMKLVTLGSRRNAFLGR